MFNVADRQGSTDNGTDTRIYTHVLGHSGLQDAELMIRETSILVGLQHENINPAVAACLDSSRQPLFVYPYMSDGNLKTFLQRRRGSAEVVIPNIELTTNITRCKDILLNV